MNDEAYSLSRLRMSPPNGWVRLAKQKIPTWVNEDGATLQYSLQSPPQETRGCTVESHVDWTRTLLHGTVCKNGSLVELSGGRCPFGVFARAVCRKGDEASYYWFLHDREETGIFVSLLSATPEDVSLADAFVQSIHVTSGALL